MNRRRLEMIRDFEEANTEPGMRMNINVKIGGREHEGGKN